MSIASYRPPFTDMIEDYYAQAICEICSRHRHRMQPYYDPYYENYRDPYVTALQVATAWALRLRRHKIRRHDSEEDSDEDSSDVEKATRAHIEATREHDNIKEKFEDIKKTFEQSEVKTGAAAKNL